MSEHLLQYLPSDSVFSRHNELPGFNLCAESICYICWL